MKRRIIAFILTVLLMTLLSDFYTQDGFDIRLFVVFLTIIWLACFKMVDYLARLKLMENNSRIDIVFFTCVLVLMFLPMMKIDHNEISTQENRTLAKYQPFLQEDKRMNFEYGRDFENWFNDHFNHREWLINLNSKLNLFLNRKLQSQTAMQGKENWLFTTRWNSVAMFQNKNLFSDDELIKIKDKMQSLQKWAQKHGMKFYIMLVPDKESLYGEYYPDGYKKEGEISRLQQITSYLKDNTNLNIMSLYEPLVSAKDKYTLFYKTGTHWNLRGAFVGYQAVMDSLRQDFPDLKKLTENDFNITPKVEADIDIASALGVNAYDTFPQEDLTYEKFELKNPQTEQNYQMLNKKKRIEEYAYHSKNKNLKRKAVFLADSQFLRMNWYMAESFKEMKHIYVGYGRMYDLPYISNELIEFAPDIFVLETGERMLERLLKIDVPEN